jgi:hypothetical protein
MQYTLKLIWRCGLRQSSSRSGISASESVACTKIFLVHDKYWTEHNVCETENYCTRRHGNNTVSLPLRLTLQNPVYFLRTTAFVILKLCTVLTVRISIGNTVICFLRYELNFCMVFIIYWASFCTSAIGKYEYLWFNRLTCSSSYIKIFHVKVLQHHVTLHVSICMVIIRRLKLLFHGNCW